MFSVFTLRLHISVTHSRTGLPPLWSAGARCDKPVFPNQPQKLRSAWRKADGWSRMLLKTKKKLLIGSCHCEHLPANGPISDKFSNTFIQLDTDRNSEAIKPTYGFLHAPLLPRKPLFFPLLFLGGGELFVTRDSRGKTISFYTFIGVLVNKMTVL